MENPTGEYIEEKAAMCKLYSIDTTRRVSDEMLEIFGGVGYFEDCKYGPVERLYRDSVSYTHLRFYKRAYSSAG